MIVHAGPQQCMIPSLLTYIAHQRGFPSNQHIKDTANGIAIADEWLMFGVTQKQSIHTRPNMWIMYLYIGTSKLQPPCISLINKLLIELMPKGIVFFPLFSDQ